MSPHACIDRPPPIQFVINSAAGSGDAASKRDVIESVLQAGGRLGELHFCAPTELTAVANEVAHRAVQAGTAVSSRVRKGMPNSVNLLHWGAGVAPGCCRIEQWDHAADVGEFVLARASEIRPARAAAPSR